MARKTSSMLDIKRKQDHIEINLTKNVESGLSSRFESVQFVHNALPEINYSSIDTTTTFLNKILQAPILISSMQAEHLGQEILIID